MQNTLVTEPIKSADNRQANGRFGLGNNANPQGRPIMGNAVSDVLRQIIEEEPDKKRALGEKLLEMALSGNLPAIREVLDRLEGKPTTRVELKDTSERESETVRLKEVLNEISDRRRTQDS
jgi:hypothetical protein